MSLLYSVAVVAIHNKQSKNWNCLSSFFPSFFLKFLFLLSLFSFSFSSYSSFSTFLLGLFSVHQLSILRLPVRLFLHFNYLLTASHKQFLIGPVGSLAFSQFRFFFCMVFRVPERQGFLFSI